LKYFFLTDIYVCEIFLPVRYSNRLRVLRAETRTTQMDLAAKTKIGMSRYWKIENGYVEATKRERAALARALKVDVQSAFPEVVSA